jgi:exopolyphosphatase/guanosine-5'-triphosphate,3'-diphosphate pyrophosphatase
VVDGRPVRVAAIDCGTNSVRLLVADDTADGLHDVVREMRIVRLGQGVDRTASLLPQAIERTRVALADYASTIESLGVERTRMVATSATRDASNRAEFVSMVRATLSVEPEVITGVEEAALSYSGAVETLPDVRGPVLLTDIGGGSTELVLGGESLRSVSMDVGSVRITERHLFDDPPTGDQVAAALATIRAALDTAARTVPLDSGATLVGVAGTVTTLAAIALGLTGYDSTAIHGSVIPTARIEDVTAELLAMTHAERAAIPALHPGRVDVISAGALVLRTILEVTGAPAVVASEHDILDGIALSLLA